VVITGAPFVQPANRGVTSYVTVIALLLLLVSVPLMVNGKLWVVRLANAVPPVAPALSLLTATSKVKLPGIVGTVVLLI
jgi:hypothetical protein